MRPGETRAQMPSPQVASAHELPSPVIFAISLLIAYEGAFRRLRLNVPSAAADRGARQAALGKPWLAA
jgi:hypothetical protein